LRTLREFYCSFNSLKTLPPELGSCTALQKMVLSNNEIKEIPSELSKLPSLKHFDLTGNQLVLFPPSVAAIDSLEKLDLGNNPKLNRAITAALKKGPDALLTYLRSAEYGALFLDVRHS